MTRPDTRQANTLIDDQIIKNNKEKKNSMPFKFFGFSRINSAVPHHPSSAVLVITSRCLFFNGSQRVSLNLLHSTRIRVSSRTAPSAQMLNFNPLMCRVGNAEGCLELQSMEIVEV